MVRGYRSLRHFRGGTEVVGFSFGSTGEKNINRKNKVSLVLKKTGFWYL